MIGPPPEPDAGDTFQWGNHDHTLIIWRQAGPPEQELWVPVTPDGQPANSDWIRIKDWLDAGLVTIAPEPPPPAPPVGA